MNEVQKLLQEADLPQLMEREQMKKILLDNEYGYVPDIPYEMTVAEPKTLEARYCCGNAALSEVNITITTQYGSHTFPVKRLLHNDGKDHPFFVFLNFRANAPDHYYPLEEIADRGFSVLSLNYADITEDNDACRDSDFDDRVARILLKNGRETPDTCGKIAIWAWAASRILDYAQTLHGLDLNQAAVIGHSRLGKTALVAGMMDERFRYVFSNDSGCSGASLARLSLGVLNKRGKYGGEGETIKRIMGVGYWFCKKYKDFAETSIPEGFDQHFLLATIAPRFAYVASAAMDDWASPDSEFMACVAASKAWEAQGLTGFVHNGNMPGDDVTFPAGRVGYHRRPGKHFLSRTDWNRYMDFIELHRDDR